MGSVAETMAVGTLALRVLALCEATEELAASGSPPVWQMLEHRALLTAAENATSVARELAVLVGAIEQPPMAGQLPLGEGDGWAPAGEIHGELASHPAAPWFNPAQSAGPLSRGEALCAEGASMAPLVIERWRDVHGAEGGAL